MLALKQRAKLLVSIKCEFQRARACLSIQDGAQNAAITHFKPFDHAKNLICRRAQLEFLSRVNPRGKIWFSLLYFIVRGCRLSMIYIFVDEYIYLCFCFFYFFSFILQQLYVHRCLNIFWTFTATLIASIITHVWEACASNYYVRAVTFCTLKLKLVFEVLYLWLSSTLFKILLQQIWVY